MAFEGGTNTHVDGVVGYFKPVVHTPKNLQVAPDAVFQGYMGGAGTKFFKSYADYHPQQHVADICQMEDLVVMAAALDVSPRFEACLLKGLEKLEANLLGGWGLACGLT